LFNREEKQKIIILGAIIVVFLSVFAVGAVIINMEDKN
jgi:hypothetical protein